MLDLLCEERGFDFSVNRFVIQKGKIKRFFFVKGKKIGDLKVRDTLLG